MSDNLFSSLLVSLTSHASHSYPPFHLYLPSPLSHAARLNKAGLETLAICKAGFRAWVPLALGWSEEKALELEEEVQKELNTLEKRNMGDGVMGRACCLWAIRNR